MSNPERAYLEETAETLHVIITACQVGLSREVVNMVWVLWRARPYLKKATAEMLKELMDGFYLDDAVAVADCLEAHRKRLGTGGKAAAALTAELLYCFGWRYGIGEGLIRLLCVLGRQITEAKKEGREIDLDPVWNEMGHYFLHSPEMKKIYRRKEDVFLAVRFSASACSGRKAKDMVRRMTKLLAGEFENCRWPLKKSKEDRYMEAMWPLIMEEQETRDEYEAAKAGEASWKEGVS